MKQLTAFVLAILLLLVSTGCGSSTESDMAAASTAEPKPNPEMSSDSSGKEAESASKAPTPVQFGLIAEQILSGADGDIHYSYYLPESYDGSREYPLMVVMPGYDMMWFGESSSGRNINWSGFTAWTKLDTEMIVVSAQLTDWHETSARQAIELTEYFIGNFAVDTSRVYATGYSAGGETMSRAVSLRPDLYAAYLHGASQWDGSYAPIAENGVAVYIYMAEGDEYYGSAKARSAYENLHGAYEAAGWSDADILISFCRLMFLMAGISGRRPPPARRAMRQGFPAWDRAARGHRPRRRPARLRSCGAAPFSARSNIRREDHSRCSDCP